MPLNRTSQALQSHRKVLSLFPSTIYSRQRLTALLRVMAPSLIAVTFASAAHAQGTMDFSGAQTLMSTFKTFAAFLHRAEEGTLSRLIVEAAILLAAAKTNPATVLRDAAAVYKVDTDAIVLKVKQEFAAKEKAKNNPKVCTTRAKTSRAA